MSRTFAAGQYESAFLPRRLGNWQHQEPAGATQQQQPKQQLGARHFAALTTAGAPKKQQQFIADDNGHLKPGVRRISNAFRLHLGPAEAAPTRWPKPSVSLPSAPAATLGHGKGPREARGVVATRLPRRSQADQGAAAGIAA